MQAASGGEPTGTAHAGMGVAALPSTEDSARQAPARQATRPASAADATPDGGDSNALRCDQGIQLPGSGAGVRSMPAGPAATQVPCGSKPTGDLKSSGEVDVPVSPHDEDAKAQAPAQGVTPATRDQETQAPEFGDGLRFNVTLWGLAIAYLVAFLVTMVVAATATMISGKYDPQTDFIWGFFGVFNPCMFFDHYPANVFATFFVALWMAAGVLYLFVLFLIVYHMKNPLFTAMSGMLFAFVAFADASFINVLTANIYVDHHEEALPCCNDPMTVELPQSTIDRISMHGGFYNVTLAFDLLLCLWFIGSMKHLYHPYKVPVWVYLVLVGNILVQVVAIESMLAVIMSGGVTTSSYQSRDKWSTLQTWSVDIKAMLYVGHWNWMLALLWRLIAPRGLGITFEFSLGDADSSTCNGSTACSLRCVPQRRDVGNPSTHTDAMFAVVTTHPRMIIATVFKILAIMLLFTYLLQDPTAHSDVSLRISAGFRELPYTYIFAPMWIIITMMTGFGVWASIQQRRLEHLAECAGAFSEQRLKVMAWIGGLWVFCMLCNLFIIVPMFDESIAAAYATLAVIPLWVLVAYCRPGIGRDTFRSWCSAQHAVVGSWRPLAWVAVWVVLSPLSTISVVSALLQLALMVVIPYLDPGARGVRVRTTVTKPKPGRWCKGFRASADDPC